jgi:recA bacterial DNA recombination protein
MGSSAPKLVLVPQAERAQEGATSLFAALPPGHSLEISGGAQGRLSVAARLVARAQEAGEPVAWLAPESVAMFYPPDVVSVGVDLDALVVVRIPERAGPFAIVRASELLLRSGAFGLLVLDLSAGVPPRALGWQARLSGLLRMHEARMVLVTPPSGESLGPSVSLRVEPEYRVAGPHADELGLELHVLKNKLGVELSWDIERCAAPPGSYRGRDE